MRNPLGDCKRRSGIETGKSLLAGREVNNRWRAAIRKGPDLNPALLACLWLLSRAADGLERLLVIAVLLCRTHQELLVGIGALEALDKRRGRTLGIIHTGEDTA